MTITIVNGNLFNKKPDVVLVDLDNCLYDYDLAHSYAINHVQNKCSKLLNIPKNEFYKLYDEAKNIIKTRIPSVAASHSRLLYFQTMIEILTYKSNPLLALDLEQTYWREFLNEARLFNNVEDFFIKLRSLDINIILVTDLTAQIQFRKLVNFKIDVYFDYIVTSEEAGSDKSQLKPYYIAKEKIKIDKDIVIWMIGDSESDIVSSKVVFDNFSLQKINKLGNKIFEGADAYFSDFQSLIDKLEEFK